MGVTVDYRIGDIRSLDLPSHTFDAAVSWFTSFGYFTDAENRRALQEYRRVLRHQWRAAHQNAPAGVEPQTHAGNRRDPPR